jgi:hypothetical protein
VEDSGEDDRWPRRDRSCHDRSGNRVPGVVDAVGHRERTGENDHHHDHRTILSRVIDTRRLKKFTRFATVETQVAWL